MSLYAIGDVQGCYNTLCKLLDLINFDEKKDRIIFLGDILNRGKDSLKVLNLIYNYKDSMKSILGNHDILALGLYFNSVSGQRTHTLHELLNTSNKEELFLYLKSFPIAIKEDKNIFVHAGFLPGIDIDEHLKLSKEVEKTLHSNNTKDFLHKYFSRPIFEYSHDLNEEDLLILTLKANIRIRMCKNKNHMDDTFDGKPILAPIGLTPWFELFNHKEYQIFFGHWAALGYFHKNNFWCLDTGCAWGEKLSALRIEDKKLFQIKNQEN